MSVRFSQFGFVLLLTIGFDSGLAAAETLAGPVRAQIVSVIDGDTLEVSAEIWPGQRIETKVRIRGIDAPERKAKCASERERAERARLALADLVGAGPVFLTRIGGGKYYGRVLADVRTVSGLDVGAGLLRMELAAAYDGGKRVSLC
jgi:endonuclease YncB( thermonuclease family)